MRKPARIILVAASLVMVSLLTLRVGSAQDPGAKGSSYAPVVGKEEFAAVMARMKGAKAAVMKRHADLLAERYDLSNRPRAASPCRASKPIQEGVRAKLAAGRDLGQAAAMSPGRDQERGRVSPPASCRCRIRITPKAACSFPSSTSTRSSKQENRDLTRFDLDFDLPDHFLPEFPPPIFLTTRPDLGDVSKGKLVTIDNFYELFNGILNPKQLEGSAPAA